MGAQPQRVGRGLFRDEESETPWGSPLLNCLQETGRVSGAVFMSSPRADVGLYFTSLHPPAYIVLNKDCHLAFHPPPPRPGNRSLKQTCVSDAN